MSAYNYNTIFVKGDGLEKESKGYGGSIYPGHLIQVHSTTQVKVHATAGGHAQKAFAVEDEEQGNTIDDKYDVGLNLKYKVAQRGAEVFAWLKEGESVSVGDPLESAGTGELQKHTAAASNSDGAFDEGGETIYTDNIVGYALETVDLSSSSGADSASRRILIEVA